MPQKNQQLPIQGLDDHDAFLIAPQFSPNVRNVRSLRNRITRAPGATLLAPPPTPYLATNGAGASQGTFQQPAATGSQVIPHSLGVMPSAILVFSSITSTFIEDRQWFVFSATDGTDSFCVFEAGINGSAGNIVGGYSPDLILLTQHNFPLIQPYVRATFTSWNSTSFTINWASVDTTKRPTYSFVALGGAGVVAKVLTWDFPGSTGNKVVTASGFTPQCVLFGAAAKTGTDRDAALVPDNNPICVGAMSASAQWVTTSAGSTANNNRRRMQSTAACVMGVDYAGAIRASAKFVSMNANGYTVNVTTANPNAGLYDYTVASICLGAMSGVKVGSFVKPTASAPTRNTVSGVGFNPANVLLAGFKNPTSATPISDASISFGSGTGAGQAAESLFIDNGSNNTRQAYTTSSTYKTLNSAGTTVDEAQYFTGTADGFTLNWSANSTSPDEVLYVALAPIATTALSQVGVIRNYQQLYVGTTTAVEKLLMLTHKSAFDYLPQTSSTGIWTPTAEAYTGTTVQRFSIANTQGIAAWSQGVDNIRQWDGTTFGPLITTGTNHAARALLAFADRIVSVRPFFGGLDHPTQIRWCRNGLVNDWGGAGSGTLEIIETSQDPLVTGFVLGDRAYLAKRRELIELIWTGTDSPVFGTQVRVRGMGVLAPHSVGLAEQLAFWLGPDDIYMFDGSTMTAIGERVYHTITNLIDYGIVNLDQIQAAVYTPDSQYWLVVPPYVFVYDYRRDIWDWDDTRDFQAIGVFRVGTNFTADIDRSEFIVIGDSAVQTIRVDPSLTSYLGDPIDSYFETKDYTAEELLQSYGFKVTLWDLNSLRELRFQSVPGYVVEVGASVDRGVTYSTQNVTVNAQGVGVAWYQLAFSQVRFRFRRYSTDGYEIHGQWGVDWETAGYQYP